jgi:uncharacterized membrane protein (UPF0127 family)
VSNRVRLVDPHGRVVCERCELADRMLGRLRGLLGRATLPRGDGILIRPSWSIHTAFMRFPIDVVFLDRELEVLAVRHRLRPWRTATKLRAHSVLEIAAGECERLGLEIGDRLAVSAEGAA